VQPRWWNCSGQPTEQAQRIEIDGDGTIRESTLELDANEAVLGHVKPLPGYRRTQDVPAQRFATSNIVGTRCWLPSSSAASGRSAVVVMKPAENWNRDDISTGSAAVSSSRKRNTLL
jgi:hypothetical protein